MELSLESRLMSMPLTLLRMPGPRGPVLRCQGDLTVETMESLRRDLALLASVGHDALIVNLSRLRRVDVDGALALVEAGREMTERGGRLILVAGSGAAAHYLHLLGVDRVLPLCRTEAEAEALADGPAGAPPETGWETARRRTRLRWERILSKVGHAAPEELIRDVTSMFALCGTAEQEYLRVKPLELSRCQFCPLFYELGGGEGDLGCASALDPLIEAARARDWDGARTRIREIIAHLESMPLPS